MQKAVLLAAVASSPARVCQDDVRRNFISQSSSRIVAVHLAKGRNRGNGKGSQSCATSHCSFARRNGPTAKRGTSGCPENPPRCGLLSQSQLRVRVRSWRGRKNAFSKTG